eukprot:CAMPEP_0167769228 /NCGR_PEP_ID=MMETSP0110_2-20121227/17181_1 /TAXON_ID=629695 /ORGANISM="Gymnochlora sp., Strain CCMP2014" /LENGTH=362 /DNA_ID=CAMNT_0007658139 /DNA_START=887 /DNA_END=1973 /DNA_ORIENTATION=+
MLDHLKGSFALKKISHRNTHLRKEYMTIADKVAEFSKFSYEEFVWARLCIITRIFGVYANGVKTDGLVPYADMLNHKLPRETSWCYDDEKRGFTITTVKPITIGEEVFDSYGRKCNHRFFVNYGFALTENPDNEAVLKIIFDEKKSDLAPSKAAVLNALIGSNFGEHEFQVPAQFDQKTQNLLGFCRLMVINEREMGELLRYHQRKLTMESNKMTEYESYPMKIIGPLSGRNELEALALLKKAAREAMDKFETTIKFDEELIKSGEAEKKGLNFQNCVVMRLGEKKVLNWFIRLTEKSTELLKLSFPRFRSRILESLHEDLQFDLYAEHVLEPIVKKKTHCFAELMKASCHTTGTQQYMRYP